MNLIQQLRLHAEALLNAVNQNPKFFASTIHYIRRLNQLVSSGQSEMTQAELRILADKIEEFYMQWRPSGNDFYIPPRETADSDSTARDINRIVLALEALSPDEFNRLIPAKGAMQTGKQSSESNQSTAQCVFVGHGRSKLWARVQVFLQNDLNLATVTYESESRTSQSIVPVLEKMLTRATFAVLVLTAEDDTKEGARRARQNVIHEAGLFQGRLGFNKIVLLVQDGLDSFTNIDGLQYIPFSDDKIEQTFYELQRVLKREGLDA